MHSQARASNTAGNHAFWPVPVVCAALLAGCGGPSPPDDTEARTVIEQFTQQLRTGEIDAAWESTTADFKSDEGRESFRAFVQQRDVLSRPLDFEELRQIEIHGLMRWEGVLRPSGDSETPSTSVRVMIAQENDVWKVDRLVVE